MNHLSKMTFYAVLYQSLREESFNHGYALALHGSLQKDLDVVAIPWTESAGDVEDLVRALCDKAGGLITPGSKKRPDGSWERVEYPVSKPHGRLAYTIHLGGEGGYIDLSVMPKVKT
jgi:hypothetical protein